MPTLTPFRFNVRRYDKLRAAGVFGDRKVELLNGLLIMMAPGPGHDYAVSTLAEALRGRLDSKAWAVREEKPILLSAHWKPLPDVAVVRGPSSAFKEKTPGVTNVALLIEVADTTYAKDSGLKRRAYARFGVAAYWVVHLNRRVVEVYAQGPGGLDLVATYTENEEVPLSLDGREFGHVTLAGLFP